MSTYLFLQLLIGLMEWLVLLALFVGCVYLLKVIATMIVYWPTRDLLPVPPQHQTHLSRAPAVPIAYTRTEKYEEDVSLTTYPPMKALDE